MHTTDRLPLELVERLCKTLDAAGLRYCHFKSNDALDRSASGENDLDLLVDRRTVDEFFGVLLSCGFKPAELPAARRLPGVNDWYGFDPASERLVHAHIHHQLVVGDDMTKNVHVPVERAYLDHARPDGMFMVPPRSLEFVVFVIRMVLKHGSWDARATLQHRLSSSERRELQFLRSEMDHEEVDRHLAASFPFLPRSLFWQCEASLGAGRVGARDVVLAWRLQRALAAQSRHAPSVDTFLKVERRVRIAFARKVLRRKVRKRLVAGGALIAIVGGDGSGKSSAVTALCDGLGRDLDVRRFHLGKPPRGPVSIAIRTTMRAGRLVGLFRSTRVPSEDAIGVPCPGTAWLVWHTLNAHDRRRAYRAARRHATEGGIAICDRYPLEELSLMDGGRTVHLTDVDRLGPLSKALVSLEQRWLSDIRPPDLLLVMSVDPDLAVVRRPEQDANFVRRRSTEVRDAAWSSPGVSVIDADRPHAEVLAEVRAAVWGAL